MINFRKNKNKSLSVDLNQINDKVLLEKMSHTKSNDNAKKFITYKPNPNGKKIIEIKNLNKSFNRNKNHVLKNISIDLYENEHTAILGGNGAGKTTLVEILAGITKADEGEINYLYEYKNSFQEKIGIQFQDSSYPKGLSVKDIISFILDIFKSDLNKDELNALIKIFGIDEFYNKKANSLSGGQSQRLNCLLSILHKPSFLILDELSTGLDVTIKSNIKSFIKEFAKENKITLLLVSHDMDEIQYLSQRIIILKNGEIFVDAKLEDIIKEFGSLTECMDMYI
ncbi:ABC transporter ATP-binding protein [Malacoplasma penetrans]|nr:ABC transporter ATP-binding protein [Malacoplasma penetrans]RXY96791.1 ABC transporter ATP-binding protein [Malacoplasma penetrans]